MDSAISLRDADLVIPNLSDFNLQLKGGGRSSARETIGRVASGAIAKKILKQFSGTEVCFKMDD